MSQQHHPSSVAIPVAHRDPLPNASRYQLLLKIASGGMATVYVGCLSAAAGFRRIVAIKRAHPHLLEDETFKKMLVAEARMASVIRHPNVIGVHDVEELEGELLLVMDYIEGASLAQVIMASGGAAPLRPELALRVIRDACEGLHAMHQAQDDEGNPLGLVHRDISPQNIMVGIDGMARIADFGIAKASSPEWSASHTQTGALRGKTGYMAPEYIETCHADAQSDVFSLGVVAWESLTRQRLFRGSSDLDTIKMIRSKQIAPPSSLCPDLSPELDAVILKALERDPMKRFPTARAFGEALEAASSNAKALAPHGAVEEHMRLLFLDPLNSRRAAIKALQAAPPQRPVSVSEVEAAEKVNGNTPATRQPMKPSLKIALNEKPLPVLLSDEVSRTGASFEMPPRPGVPRKIVAASSAAIAVLVIAIVGLATMVSKKPSVAAASGGEEPPVVVTVSRAPAPQVQPPTTVAVNALPVATPEEASARKAAKNAPPGARPRVAVASPVTNVKPETGAPSVAMQEASKPSTASTSDVPKNPYAP